MPSTAWPGEASPKSWTVKKCFGIARSEPQEWTEKEKPFLPDSQKDQDQLKEVQTKQGGNGTFASSVFLLFNSAVGAGVLALPYCVLVGGIVPTSMAIIFFAFITGMSSTAIVAAQESSNTRDYQSIVKAYLGENVSSILSA